MNQFNADFPDPYLFDPGEEKPIGGFREVKRRNGAVSYRAHFTYKKTRYSVTFRADREAKNFLEWASHFTHWEVPNKRKLRKWVNNFRNEMGCPDLQLWYFSASPA